MHAGSLPLPAMSFKVETHPSGELDYLCGFHSFVFTAIFCASARSAAVTALAINSICILNVGRIWPAAIRKARPLASEKSDHRLCYAECLAAFNATRFLRKSVTGDRQCLDSPQSGQRIHRPIYCSSIRNRAGPGFPSTLRCMP